MIENKPLVKFISTGGTIASTSEVAQGNEYKNYQVSKDADELIETVPKLESYIDVEFNDLMNKESPKLLIQDYIKIAKAITEAESEGVDGVVITHGTSSIEETAFFCDLVLDLSIPVAFVGAMRPADAIDADGPANLLNAARMMNVDAFQEGSGSRGVYVVLNETIHAARDVTKSDTWALESFESGQPGPVARFTDEEIQMYREPKSYSADLTDCDLEDTAEMTVPIVTTGAGAQGTLMQQALEGEFSADGFVVQTTGRGGTSPDITQASIEAVESGIPVVTTPRIFYGPLMSSDEPGTIIPMENVHGWKARIHLIVCLTITREIEEIRELMAESKYGQSVVAPAEI
jgi:L-asparaginase